MLVNIPASRRRVVAVSFPRDLGVTRRSARAGNTGKTAGDTRPASSTPVYTGDKLNATYALGGPKCLTKVLQKLSGLKINHFMAWTSPDSRRWSTPSAASRCAAPSR